MTDNSSSSPQIPQSPSAITQSSPQLPPLHPQNPNPSPMLTSSPSAAAFQNLQRARLTTQQQQQEFTAAIAARHFGGGGGGTQMNFGQPGQSLTQLNNIQAQLLLQQSRQKVGAIQGMQFNAGNSSGQALQGMQAMGMMSSFGMNQQIRANGTLSYGQQRFNHAQLRQQQIPMQNSLISPQKLQGQGLPRGSSLTAMNAHCSGLTQNGQSTSVQNALAQQPWLKQMQQGISSQASPSHLLQQHQRQQQVFSPQQPASSQLQHQKSSGLNQPQISQLHQMHLGSPRQGQPQQQQFIQQQIQLQMLQQLQQQQQSPRMQGSGQQRSVSLTGSQPGTPASVTTNTGGNSSQGAETTNQLLGKRKIQDLVSQVDPFGKLDPEVEDILLEIADDFIDSVTTFACNLAKHRKSSTLESKDLLLHLDKNLHLTIPGFTKEGQKYHTKSLPKDAHASRLELIRGSMESQPFERNTATKSAGKPAVPDSSLSRPLKASPSSEQLLLSMAAPKMLQNVPQF